MLIQPSQNVRVLKRVPKDSRVPLAESLSDKTNDDVVYNVEDITKWLIFLTSFLFFGATENKWTQTNHMHELFDKKKLQNSIPKFQARL